MSTKKISIKRYPLAVNCTVYRRSETNKDNHGKLIEIDVDRVWGKVLWPGSDQPTQHALTALCAPEEWEEIREKQAQMVSFWQGGAR